MCDSFICICCVWLQVVKLELDIELAASAREHRLMRKPFGSGPRRLLKTRVRHSIDDKEASGEVLLENKQPKCFSTLVSPKSGHWPMRTHADYTKVCVQWGTLNWVSICLCLVSQCDRLLFPSRGCCGIHLLNWSHPVCIRLALSRYQTRLQIIQFACSNSIWLNMMLPR